MKNNRLTDNLNDENNNNNRFESQNNYELKNKIFDFNDEFKQIESSYHQSQQQTQVEIEINDNPCNSQRLLNFNSERFGMLFI